MAFPGGTGTHITVGGLKFELHRSGKIELDLTDVNLDQHRFIETCRMMQQSRFSILDCLKLRDLATRLANVNQRTQFPTSNSFRFGELRKDSLDDARKYLQGLWDSAASQNLLQLPPDMESLIEQLMLIAEEIQLEERILMARKFPSEQSGYVYLFKLSTGHYKIGLSKNPQRRGREIVSGLPLTIELIHQIPSNQTACLEDELHTKYSRFRHEQTEWFMLEQSHIDAVCAIKERNYEWINNPKWDKWINPHSPEASPLTEST
jgi:hypothetical protein